MEENRIVKKFQSNWYNAKISGFGIKLDYGYK